MSAWPHAGQPWSWSESVTRRVGLVWAQKNTWGGRSVGGPAAPRRAVCCGLLGEAEVFAGADFDVEARHGLDEVFGVVLLRVIEEIIHAAVLN